MSISSEMVYLTDNGRAVCGAHLGQTAKATGHDLSGQEILPCTPDVVREAKAEGWEISCEDCGKKASLLHV
jgi:hypothetical protein